jgi:hypothetical protein
MSNDKKTGKIRLTGSIEASIITKYTISVAGSIEFKYFSDTLNNFARISENRFDWYMLKSGYPTSIMTTISITDADKILHVSFSRNIATILYAPIASSAGQNVITILEHLGSDDVGIIKKQASFGKIGDATLQYKMSAKCLCISIRI